MKAQKRSQKTGAASHNGRKANSILQAREASSPCIGDGKTWTIQATIDGLDNYIHDLWGSGTSDVFACGIGGRMLHYDGKMWNKVATPTGNDLKGMWGSSASELYVVGDRGTILKRR